MIKSTKGPRGTQFMPISGAKEKMYTSLTRTQRKDIAMIKAFCAKTRKCATQEPPTFTEGQGMIKGILLNYADFRQQGVECTLIPKYKEKD